MKESGLKGAALVTGAAHRVGAVLARRLAKAGYAVVIHHHRSAKSAEALVAEIESAGGRAATLHADLTDRSQRARLIARAAEPFGPLTVLINNASVYEPDSAGTLDEALWDDHFALHLEAPVFLARDFAAQLPEGVEGNVINMIDARVLQPVPAYFSYALSKAALFSATRTLAQSLAPRIRVNAVGPGPTLPERGQSAEAFAARNRQLLLGHGSPPDDIAEAVLYLLSAQSVTGQMLAVDGGIHLEWPDWADPTPRDK
ncbi:MAG: SDR family oxidoreductase [Alphaproteobacteria bacterium]|nr:SDR family oxidoreductase [Alphaproteobacteria bacterium]